MISELTLNVVGVGSKALLGPERRKRTSPSQAPDYKAAYNEKLFERHGGKAAYWRNANLKAKYGITATQYDQMLEAQGHGCAICGRRECKSGKALAVDHSHKTGKVRGLLCGDCNKALGLLADSPELLTRAARYLESQGPNNAICATQSGHNTKKPA